MTLDIKIMTKVNMLKSLEKTLYDFVETNKKDIMYAFPDILQFVIETLMFVVGNQVAQHFKDELLHNDEKINDALNSLKKISNNYFEDAFRKVIEFRKMDDSEKCH